jgi:predicted RND superfamily exporter protein
LTEKKNPQNETVDWAERLKASMNAEPAETPARATSPTAEEDDLAALLRAQLAHRAESADTFTYDLDTSEFEDETEEAEEAEAAEESEETFALVENIRAISEKYYPGDHYLAGKGVSTYDLKASITSDMTVVNLVAIGSVFLILLITMRSVIKPILLVLSIEAAIWVNMTIPYFADEPIFYLAYLIISSVQLGATVDYAILLASRYQENRATMEKNQAVIQTISDVFVSIMTSGSAMTVVGLLLGVMSTNQLLAQLGIFIGRGALFSLVIVLFVLPGMLHLFDHVIIRNKAADPKRKVK